MGDNEELAVDYDYAKKMKNITAMIRCVTVTLDPRIPFKIS